MQFTRLAGIPSQAGAIQRKWGARRAQLAIERGVPTDPLTTPLPTTTMLGSALAASVVGQVALDGDVLHVTGEMPTLDFGGGAVTLVHDAAEDQLSCSGRIQATDLFVEVDGTMMSVVALLRRVAMMEEQLEAMKRFVGWVPPSAPPPLTCRRSLLHRHRHHNPHLRRHRYRRHQSIL